MTGDDKRIGCSAEGHVSHVYEDRMSSRPLGLSSYGVDKMARLRIYRQNNGDMLNLVRYQKQEFKLAVGAEAVICNASEMFASEKRIKKRYGFLTDIQVYSIPYTHIKKIAALKDHIWGL